MPSRAPRRCTTPGCGAMATPPDSKCAVHEKRRPRRSASSKGYNAEHAHRFRAGVLARDPVCVLCRTAPATQADHYPLSKRELQARGMDEHDPRRGRGLCASCHSKETAKHQPGGWNAGPRY